MVMPWLEKDNLQKWLKQPVLNIESEDSNVNGYLSKMVKLRVTVQDGSTNGTKIYPLIVKCRLLKGNTGDIFGETDIFRKEVEFYSKTTHAIQDILKEVYPQDHESIAPKCYHACEDFIVFEDLIDPGFRMPDRMAGLNLEQCLLVMRTLGKFHAASAVLIERKPQDLEVYKNHMFQDPRIQESFGNLLQALCTNLAEELETWEEEWHKYVPKLKYLASNFIPLLENTCKRSDSDFNVLIHGDAWTYNILFRDDPFSIRLVDYQLSAHTSAAIDLIYFLCTSPKRDVRAINIQRLILEYHNTLSTTLIALKYKNIPSLRDITQDIGKKSLYALFCLSCPYAVLQCDPESGFSFDECIVNPKAPGPKMYGEEYRKNLRMMLPMFVDYETLEHLIPV